MAQALNICCIMPVKILSMDLDYQGTHPSGYAHSPDILCPLLHGLEKKAYLRSREERDGKRARHVYTITAKGRKAFAAAREKVRELFGELFEAEL